MKKYFLSLVLVILSCVVSFGATSYGVGAPYSITATASGDVYMDTSKHELWKANSTTKGDWSKLTPVVADGSTDAPFSALSVVSVSATSLDVASGVNLLDVVENITTATESAAIATTSRLISLTSANTGDALSLADGDEGQRMTIVYSAETAITDTIVVTPANLLGGTTITFNDVGDFAELVFVNGTWVMMSGSAIKA